MSHLHRELAPISENAWKEIEKRSGPHAAELPGRPPGRRLLRPPRLGLLGREPRAGSNGSRARSTVSKPACGSSSRWSSCATGSRWPGPTSRTSTGAGPTPICPRWPRRPSSAALAEDHIVFEGFKEAHITGIAEASTFPPIEIDDNYAEYPKLVARAVSSLRESGIDGPYAAALGPRCWTGVIETTEDGGYPVLEHLRLILGGPVVWAPAVDGAVVMSTRGEDFQLTCGEDMALGYLSPRCRHRRAVPGGEHRLPGRSRPRRPSPSGITSASPAGFPWPGT